MLIKDPYPRLRAYLVENGMAIYDVVTVKKRLRTPWARLESYPVSPRAGLKIENIRQAFPDAEIQIAGSFLRIGLAIGSTTVLNNQVGDITIPHIRNWIVISTDD